MNFKGRKKYHSPAAAKVIEDEIIFDNILSDDDDDDIADNHTDADKSTTKFNNTTTMKNWNQYYYNNNSSRSHRNKHEDLYTVSDVESMRDITELEIDNTTTTINNHEEDDDDDDDDDEVILRTVCPQDDPESLNQILLLQHSMKIASQSSITSKKNMRQQQQQPQQQQLTRYNNNNPRNTKIEDDTDYYTDRWLQPAIVDDNDNDAYDDDDDQEMIFEYVENIQQDYALKLHEEAMRNSKVQTLVVKEFEEEPNTTTSNNNENAGLFIIDKALARKELLVQQQILPDLEPTGYFELRRKHHLSIRYGIILMIIMMILSLSIGLSLGARRQHANDMKLPMPEQTVDEVRASLPQKNGSNDDDDDINKSNPLMHIHYNTTASKPTSSSSSNSSTTSSSSSTTKNSTTTTTTTKEGNSTSTSTNSTIHEATKDELVDALKEVRPYQTILYINPGGRKSYLDTRDHVWKPDDPYVNGMGGTSRQCTLPDDMMQLYNNLSSDDKDSFNLLCSERWFDFDRDDQLSAVKLGDRSGGEYEIPVPHGTYKVIMHFAEFGINGTAPTMQAGERIFDIYLEGSLVRKGLDIIRDSTNKDLWSALPVMLHAASVKVIGVASVSDGYLTIAFNPVKGDPKINSIEVRPIDDSYIHFPGK